MNFFYRTKGVISIFLILIMLPLFTVSAILVDGARYQSAKTIIQEAGDLAAYSTISNYNVELKDRYGLFAIDDADVNKAFNEYFKATLGCSDSEADSYSQMVQNMMNGLIGGNEYKDAKFFDLYDFEILNATASADFNLAQPDVLKSQIVEFMKYRGVETVLERFEILTNSKALSEENEKNKRTLDAMQELSGLDENTTGSIYTQLNALPAAIDNYNLTLEHVGTNTYSLGGHLVNEMVEMSFRSDSLDSYAKTRSTSANKILNQIGSAKEAYDALVGKVDSIITDAQQAKTKYLNLKEKYKDQKEICEDIDKEIETLNKILDANSNSSESVVYLKSRLKYPDENFSNLYSEVLAINGRFDTAHSTFKKEVDQLRKKMEEEYCTEEEIEEAIKYEIRYHLDVHGNGNNWKYTDYEPAFDTQKESEIRSNAQMQIEQVNLVQYVSSMSNYRCPAITNAYDKRAEKDSADAKNDGIIEADKDYKGYADEVAGEANTKDKEDTEAKKDKEVNNKIPNDVYKNLPSQLAKVPKEKEKAAADVNTENASSVINSAGSVADEILGALETGRDEVLAFCYIFDMFKTRVTAKEIGVVENANKFSYKDTTHNEWYHTKWRYKDPRGEIDSRDRVKMTDLTTFFNSKEVEYIFGGDESEAVNGAIVYSWIYGTRLANNLVAVYLNDTAKLQCEALAAACSAATLGTVPPAVFKWVFIAAWAAGETSFELSLLIDEGFRIPLVKTDKLYIKSFLDIADAIANKSNLVSRSTDVKSKVLNVCYEDYLLILLCFVGSDKRMLRVADLIQLNMNADGGDFSMNHANTYVKCDTDVRIKFLFQPIQQFKDSYRSSGIKISNSIYQGY